MLDFTPDELRVFAQSAAEAFATPESQAALAVMAQSIADEIDAKILEEICSK